MKINVLVIDDDIDWREIISKFVSMNPLLNLIGACESAIEAYGVLAEKNIDLMISDIEMPHLSGLAFIKSINNPPLTIFVTSHRDYALDCYEVSPIDFLLKPLDYGRFLQAVEKARKRLESDTNTKVSIEPYFFIRESTNFVQIPYSEVLYIKAQDNSLNIVTKDHIYSPILTISKLEEKLNANVFLRVHRSFIVHRAAIRTVTKNDIELNTGERIPIGDQYRNKINHKHVEAFSIGRS